MVVGGGAEGRVLTTQNFLQVAGLEVHACKGFEDQGHASTQIVITYVARQGADTKIQRGLGIVATRVRVYANNVCGV